MSARREKGRQFTWRPFLFGGKLKPFQPIAQLPIAMTSGLILRKTTELLQPYSGDDLEADPVTAFVNSSKNDMAACVTPVR